jgi:hypothetical protein
MVPVKTRWLALAVLGAAVILQGGCVPTGVWLPDSSGYLYTAGQDSDQVLLYDLAKRQTRVIVKNTKALTDVPAVSPDGKQIAVAPFTKGDEGWSLQVVVYDLAGKETQHSESFSWKYNEPQEMDAPKPKSEVYWAPQGDKLLVMVSDNPGIYDLKKKTMTKLSDLRPMIIGNRLSCPDDKGFLIGGGSISYVDWNGEEKPVALKNFQLDADKDVDLVVMALYPQIYNTRWDGDIACIRWSKREMRIDTKKREATLEDVKEEQTADKKTIQQTYSFGKEGPTVRVVELLARTFDKTSEREDSGYGEFRVELVKPGEDKPRVLLDKFAGGVQLLPSPNKKLLAIECGVSPTIQKQAKPKRTIILVNDKGEVVAEIDGLKTM